MIRRFSGRVASVAAAGLLCASLVAGVPAQAAPNDPNTDGATATSIDNGSAIVELSLAPTSTASAVDRGMGKRVNFQGSATKSYRAKLNAQRNDFKQWLKTNAPKVKVTGEYDISLNAVAVRLNGTPLQTLRAAPNVLAATFQARYAPTAADPDLARIKAVAGWAAAGATTAASDPTRWAGAGVKVGVVDTGIDVTHPCFSDTGYPKAAQSGDPRFTNNKVIVARVFNNKLNQSGYTAAGVGSHGSHVAGTIACNLQTQAIVDGASIPYDPSGVAPGALLGSYNVFPGDVEDARTEDIVNALDAAAADGMDVINMSLGGDAHGSQDLGTVAVDNLDRAGIVVAVSAGNEGADGAFSIGSPGSAERALTAGASSVGHFVGVPILLAGQVIATGVIGDFPVPSTSLNATLAAVPGDPLGLACSAVSADLTGKIALLSRGTCSFSAKVKAAQDAGAVAVIVVNNRPGDPIAMGLTDGIATNIPAVMVAQSDLDALLAAVGSEVTVDKTRSYTDTGNNDILGDFSSIGPVDVSYRVKPDVVAPGVNVLSSVPASDCFGSSWVGTVGCWAFYQGTSMASPHLAGMAAVVRGAHPSWDAWQVRSAIVNSATVDGVFQTEAIDKVERNVQRVGAGLANLKAAVDSTVVFDRVSVSFGAVAGGVPKTETVKVTNLGATSQSLPVSVKSSSGPGAFKASASSLNLAAGGSATLTITYSAAKASGPTQAQLYVGGAHVVLYGFAK